MTPKRVESFRVRLVKSGLSARSLIEFVGATAAAGACDPGADPALPRGQGALYRQFRGGGLDRQSALLLAEAFGQESATEIGRRGSRALARAKRNAKVKQYYDELRAGGVREEAARQMAEALVDPVRSLTSGTVASCVDGR